MEARLFCFLLALQMVSWSTCAATSRPLAPNEPVHHHVITGRRPESLQVPSSPSSSSKEMGGGAAMNKAYAEVGPFKCRPLLQASAAMWVCSIQTMSLRVGNARCGPSLYSP
ncbi:hypothetical protein HRI_002275100 [Hibiscus trionum]|uniref:Uncharacterized protein n=1 Tax=Hibiscus trionum TaxID=183268 RepID=A0A9W7M358_HIBTR|nr:hypothetical protein HRI_002275100 [Hibiscus trionum]